MEKVLILLGGNSVSGAEYVLKDYLEKTEKKYIILTTEEIKKTRIFELENVEIITTKYLSSLGAGDCKYKKIKKLYYVFKLKNKIKDILEKYEIKKLLLNNTGDLYNILFFSGNKDLKIYLYIHDMLDKKSFYSKYLLFKIKRIEKILTVSEACKRNILSIVNDDKKILRVYNGLEILKNKSFKKDILNNILFVGSLIERKNPLEFIEFMYEFNKIKKIKGIIIYKYYDLEIKKEIEKKILQYKLDIEMLYNQPRERIQEKYEKASYLFISSKKDPLPTVVLESLNNLTPVIGKEIDGIPEMILDGKNGFLYQDTDNFSKIISKIVNINKEQYVNMQKECKDIILKKFDILIKVKKLNEILE